MLLYITVKVAGQQFDCSDLSEWFIRFFSTKHIYIVHRSPRCDINVIWRYNNSISDLCITVMSVPAVWRYLRSVTAVATHCLLSTKQVAGQTLSLRRTSQWTMYTSNEINIDVPEEWAEAVDASTLPLLSDGDDWWPHPRSWYQQRSPLSLTARPASSR